MRIARWLLICSLIVLVVRPVSAADSKQLITKLTPEISYIHSSNPSEKFFAVRVDEAASLRVVLAHDQVDGPKETVASMCKRYRCIAAVNGDFFGGTVAHGGLVQKGHILRTPDASSGQAWIGQDMEATPSAKKLPVVTLANGKSQLWPINLAPVLNKSTIYTSAYGGVVPSGADSPVLIYQCLCRNRPDNAGLKYNLRFIRNIISGTMPKLGRNQIGLRMPAVSLADFLISGRIISLQLPVIKSGESIGAHPVILDDGKIPPMQDSFALSLHPRSVYGCNEKRRCWLIAIDSRVTLTKAAKIARQLGVSDGINLDGGGSTTFVVRGRTLNEPADKAEREVASAVIVVKRTTKITSNPNNPPVKTANMYYVQLKPKAVAVKSNQIKISFAAPGLKSEKTKKNSFSGTHIGLKATAAVLIGTWFGMYILYYRGRKMQLFP